MRPPQRDQRLIGFARQQRQQPTEAEQRLWWELRRARMGGRRFRRQHPIGPYIADFACLELHLVVEVDGSQHAENPYDRRRDAYMEDRGWTVLRFWSWDVLKETENVVDAIGLTMERLESRPTQ